MTKQQIFTKVKKHLLKQNKRSTVTTPTYKGCAYRGRNGMSCAIGCLIPDKLYAPFIEGRSIGSSMHDSLFVEVLRKSVGTLTDGKLKLLEALQSVHDDLKPKDWKEDLKEIASMFGLKDV